MTGDTNKTSPAFCLRVQTPILAPSTGSGETLSNLNLYKSERRSVGAPHPGRQGRLLSGPARRRARPPALSHHTRSASPALPSPPGSSPGTPEHLRERYLSPARLPSLSGAHRSVSFPCFSSPNLFSSWPLALPRLPTSPHELRCPGRARTLRSLTQPDGREAASATSQALGRCPLSSPRVPATGSETS